MGVTAPVRVRVRGSFILKMSQKGVVCDTKVPTRFLFTPLKSIGKKGENKIDRPKNVTFFFGSEKK